MPVAWVSFAVILTVEPWQETGLSSADFTETSGRISYTITPIRQLWKRLLCTPHICETLALISWALPSFPQIKAHLSMNICVVDIRRAEPRFEAKLELRLATWLSSKLKIGPAQPGLLKAWIEPDKYRYNTRTISIWHLSFKLDCLSLF